MSSLGYQLIEKIGEGGFGEVWRAIDSAGRPCALKFLLDRSPSFLDSLRDEVAKLIKLRGAPGVITILDYDLDGPYPYIALELADGNLLELVGSGMELGTAARFGLHIARVIQEAHERGVVHRDIKPENILLQDGSVRLADFGLGKGFESMMLTIGGAGTPGYMAPEQLTGPAGVPADVFALGATLFHLITGERPPVDSHSLDPRWHARGCPSFLATLVIEMTCARWQERPSLKTVVLRLEEFLRPTTRQTRRPRAPSPPPGRTHASTASSWGSGTAKPATKAGGLLALLAAAGVGGLYALSRRNTYDPKVDRYRGKDGQFKSGAWD